MRPLKIWLMNDMNRFRKRKPYLATARGRVVRNPMRELTFKQLASAKTMLSAPDQQVLVGYFSYYGERILCMLPSEIDCPENLSLIGSLLCKYAPGKITDVFLKAHFKTSIDVLRLAVALSGGDLSLATPCKFKGVTGGVRQVLLGLIEVTASEPTENMSMNPTEHWDRLAKKLRLKVPRYPLPLPTPLQRQRQP